MGRGELEKEGFEPGGVQLDSLRRFERVVGREHDDTCTPESEDEMQTKLGKVRRRRKVEREGAGRLDPFEELWRGLGRTVVLPTIVGTIGRSSLMTEKKKKRSDLLASLRSFEGGRR